MLAAKATRFLVLSAVLSLLVVAGRLGRLKTTEATDEAGAAIAGSKANLDLPYDFAGLAEDDEAAPEILVFYGEIYEGDTIVFALDESGSMVDQGRWQLQSRELIRSVNELSSQADFGIVYYGSRVTPFRPRAVPATAASKGAAVAFVQSRRPAGDTCLFEGVIKALEIVHTSDSARGTVIVTGDGEPDNCSTGNRASAAEVKALIQKTVAANPGLKTKVHTLWVGSAGTSADFMKQLASMHGGKFKTVGR